MDAAPGASLLANRCYGINSGQVLDLNQMQLENDPNQLVLSEIMAGLCLQDRKLFSGNFQCKTRVIEFSILLII